MESIIRTILYWLILKMRNKYLFFAILPFVFLSCRKSESNSSPTDNLVVYKDTVFTKYFQRTSGWIAGDGAHSIPLKDDRSLWSFGDSNIGFYDAATKTIPCLFQVRNAGLTMGLSSPASQITFTGRGSPASLYALGTNNNYWFWPLDGHQYGDTVYNFLQRIHLTGSGNNLSFEIVDSSYVAKIIYPVLSVVGYSLLPEKNGIIFGKGVVADDAARLIYVYGTKPGTQGNDLFVARFQRSNIYIPWEFYNGSGWSKDASKAVKIYSEFTSSFNVCKINKKFVLITTELSVGCDQGKNIYTQTADNPFGPFRNRKAIWQVDDLMQGHYPVFYLANPHPEYNNSKNELLVTYCINGYGTCVNTCIGNRKDPDVYRPRAIRIPYKLIDNDL
jgi:hypothetical protein